MKIERRGNPGAEKPALCYPDGERRDVSIYITEIDAALIGADWRSALASLARESMPVVDSRSRLAPCLIPPRRIIATQVPDPGAAQLELALRSGRPAGANDLIDLPAGEAECLAGVAAVVRAGELGPEVSALCLFMQVLPVLARRTPLTRGAACSRDGLLSLGPALVTPKDIAEGEHSPLAIELLVDQAMQSGIWSPDIRSIRSAVAAAHEEVGLCTGDILLVGGLGSDAIGSQPVRIKAGDRVTIRSPLGIQERRCDAPKQLN